MTYRLLIVLYILLLLCPKSIQAQRFEGTIECGMSGSQVSGDELSGFNKGGLLAGIGVCYPIMERTQLILKLLYLQKGSRKPTDSENNDYTYYLLRLNYIEAPVLIRHSFNRRLYGEIGPSIAYLVKSSEQDENGEIPYRRAFKKMDFSLNANLGFAFSTALDVRVSFWQSVLPVREHESGASYRLNHGQYNTVVALSLMMHIKPGQKEETKNP